MVFEPKARCLALFAFLSQTASAFIPETFSDGRHSTRLISANHPRSSNSALTMWFPDEGMEVARGSFGWWIMGAAGSGGAARSAFPKLYNDFVEIQGLRGVGPTLGGPTIGLSPLLGYPEDVCLKDVEMVVNNPLNIEEITKRYPIKGNFLAAKGYLTLDAFKMANAEANPLAVRVVFDSFGKPKAVEPTLAQKLLDKYKENPNDIKPNLLLGKLSVYTAAATLLFLLGLADFASATDLYRGWFPDWPGGQDFPRNLFTPEGNVFKIGEYFLWDVPPGK